MVDTSSAFGTLTWNANGSLGQLAITDPFNTGNAQTCKHGHDDVARIATADCGMGKWGQSFLYDPFGNISKSVLASHTGTSFMPLYSSSTNRYTPIGNSTPTYDANGNSTWETSHFYAWDSEGKLAQLDSGATALTYDALGRRVEQNKSSVYTQIVYGPDGGKLALMSGQTVSSYYRHSDWLGSSRIASTPSRTVYYDTAYNPCGEPYAETGTTNGDFTGQNQDMTTDEYDFLYREYHAAQGRWVSPEPAGQSAVDPATPQSWNRYGYAANNPPASIDPLGLCDPNDPSCLTGTGITCEWWQVWCWSGAPSSEPSAEPGTYAWSMNGGWHVSSNQANQGPGEGGSSGNGSPAKNEQAKRNVESTADALVTFGLSTFVPGYAAVKTVAGAFDVNLNPVQALFGDKPLLSAGPTIPSAAAGTPSVYWFYRQSVFGGAGGQARLDCLQDHASRTFSGAQDAAKYGSGSGIDALQGLSKAASFAGRVTGVLSAVSAGYDVYLCWAGN